VEWPGGRQPLDLPYSYIIHAPPDANGMESLHAHVSTPAMDREREQAFNVYRKDNQHTREVAERETERIFELSRLRDRELGLDLQPEMALDFLDRGIEFHGREASIAQGVQAGVVVQEEGERVAGTQPGYGVR
jgi:hypothetical protein